MIVCVAMGTNRVARTHGIEFDGFGQLTHKLIVEVVRIGVEHVLDCFVVPDEFSPQTSSLQMRVRECIDHRDSLFGNPLNEKRV